MSSYNAFFALCACPTHPCPFKHIYLEADLIQFEDTNILDYYFTLQRLYKPSVQIENYTVHTIYLFKTVRNAKDVQRKEFYPIYTSAAVMLVTHFASSPHRQTV